jgi:glycosyltransferase involved in cell wall biosynthesis
MQTKIKVVWICMFSNKEIQKKLNVNKTTNEYGQWIPNLISMFENDGNIELHIISGHHFISKYKHWNEGNINYHFYNCGIPFIGNGWPLFFNLNYWSNFLYDKFITRKIIKSIGPDIIHLWGAENAIYSSTILQFKNKIPVIISIQGFVEKGKKYTENIRFKVQKIIFENFDSFYVTCQWVGNKIKLINQNANILKHVFPTTHPQIIEEENSLFKTNDIVFFARVTKSKGIEDLLNALSILKKKGSYFKLQIIGSTTIDYKRILENLIVELDIFELVEWIGYLPSQNDVFKLVQQSKISVLPTHNEIFASSIRELMSIGIPIISNNVGCLPILNEERKSIILIEKGNSVLLANSIYDLLNNSELQKELSKNGKLTIREINNYETIKNDIINGYKFILKK